MNTTNLASLIAIENLRTIGVTFTKGFDDDTNAKIYTYKTIDPTIIPGDFVVVRVQNDKYKVVPVVRVDSVADLSMDSVQYTWIVQKVNSKEYLDLINKEQEIANTLRELEQTALINSAKDMLSEKLGVTPLELEAKLKE